MTTIRLENASPLPFAGFLRANVDDGPPFSGVYRLPNGRSALLVPGAITGLDTQALDVQCILDPGEKVVFEVPAGTMGEPFMQPQLPGDPLSFFGGPMTIAGEPMPFVGLPASDGAAITALLRTRVGPFVVEVHLRWYPMQPGLAYGEMIVTHSSPSTPALVATILQDFTLRFGDALIGFPGREPGFGPAIEAGTSFGDGQARAFPLLFLWPRHANQTYALSFFGLMTNRISMRAISKLWPNGNPVLPVNFSPRAHVTPILDLAAKRLHSWGPTVVGPNMSSGDTGAQEDQVFVRGEMMHENGGLCDVLAYLGALKMSNRPCHHREADGSLLDYNGHKTPRLVLWDMRPHWHPAVSPDQLGKTAGLSVPQANGWWGADVEHALFNTSMGGARTSGSWACQVELSTIARNYLFQWTIENGLSTTQPYAARARGWECILAVHLWRGLADRTLAQAVRDRCIGRFDRFAGWYGANEGRNLLDIRVDDPRLGAGERWMPWQVAVQAYGFDLAGEVFGHAGMRQIGLAAARLVVDLAYVDMSIDTPGKTLVSLMDGVHVHESCRTKLVYDEAAGCDLEYSDSLPDIGPWMEDALGSLGEDLPIAGRSSKEADISVPWHTRDVVAVNGADVTVGYFDLFGCPMAPAVVLRHEPGNERARSIWNDVLQRSTQLRHTAWIAPEVPS